MDIVRKEFKEVFHEPMSSLGFTYAGNCFYRPINDVLQTLTLSKTKWDFSFQHLIIPLCIPLSKNLPGGNLGPTEEYKRSEQAFSSVMWSKAIYPTPFIREYDEKNIHSGMKEGLVCVMGESIPLFNKGTDTKSAYWAIIESQQKLLSGMKAGYILHDVSLKWMALKNKEYERAYIHQAALVCQNMGCIDHNTGEKDLLRPEMRKKWETYQDDDQPFLKENRDLLHRIINRDDEYFDKLIEERTKITLNFLDKVSKSPCKYGSCRYYEYSA